ncbi:sigma-70 family RNA polymerase sigma factor [Sorangium sp. So ce1000]|uniref:sigma-70 family RNA polymerase sigma factor n=1 Tax=Sorangium sp. So ce1000 TaxID=3133325 RepID=UPI003F614C9C
MTEPRKGARRPPAARHPRKKPTMAEILAERGIVLATLAGIPKRDRRDVEAEVLLNAWNAIRRGLYRPDPRDKPRDALRKWLHGIAWRLASHYVHSAYARRAVLHPSPLGLLREPVGIDMHAQIEAREVLDAMTELPDWQLEALLSVDDPESLVAYAKRRRMNPSTAASRLRIAREALALKLRRWRR